MTDHRYVSFLQRFTSCSSRFWYELKERTTCGCIFLRGMRPLGPGLVKEKMLRRKVQFALGILSLAGVCLASPGVARGQAAAEDQSPAQSPATTAQGPQQDSTTDETGTFFP